MSGKGSVWGGALLIAGSCIGAGMLALPILTGIAGFVPSLWMFLIAWSFMTLTGLLLIEVNGWFTGPVNLLSMVSKTLGKYGRFASWILYLFLFYALLVAYISSSGNHVSAFALRNLHLTVPDWAGGIFFVLLFGWVIYFGTRPVDLLNRWLMLGKITAYIALIALGFEYVHSTQLKFYEPQYAPLALPVLIISFGFHNMIPSLSAYLHGDTKRVKQAILLGSFFALGIYLIWEIIALGALPVDVILGSYRKDIDAAQALRDYIGKSAFGMAAGLLAFFAILTSFLGQSLSLVHFWADGLKKEKRESVFLCALALLPPLIFSAIYPQFFFKALNFAGGICAVILFGIFPVLMVWIGRYRHKTPSNYRTMGGQPLLIAILLFSLAVLFYQICETCGISIFPAPVGM